MKTIYYFLQWHVRKYKFRSHHLMLVAMLLLLGGTGIAISGHAHLGSSMVILGCILIVVFFLKWAIWDPIYDSYQEFKEEQRNLLNKINYGEKDYERFRRQ